MSASFLQILSETFGWVYTLLWSLSFYPQPIHNFRRRSVSGINIDFFVINVLGFVAYFISNAVFLYSPTIRAQYAERHHGLTPTVQFNDLAFAGHAAILASIALSQFYVPVWKFEKKDKNDPDLKLSWTMFGVFIGCLAGVCIVTVIVAVGPRDDVRKGWAWIDVVSNSKSNTIVAKWLMVYPLDLRHFLCQALHHTHKIHAADPHQLPQQEYERMAYSADPL